MDNNLLYEINKKLDFLLTPQKKKVVKTDEEMIAEYERRIDLKFLRKNLNK